MILWVLLALMAGTGLAFPNDRPVHDPDTPLDTLSVEELDDLLSKKIMDLEVKILKTYEEQLKEHEESLQHLYRQRRDISLPTLPTLESDSWHSYVFDTHPYREKLVVTNFTTKKFDYIQAIEDVYPVNLDNINAIYKGDSGVGFILQNGNLTNLLVRNKWTQTLSGCACTVGGTDTGCACCVEGGTLCPVSSNSDTCIAIGGTNQDCVDGKPGHLKLDSAVAFEYHLQGVDYPLGLRQVVIVAKGDTVHFYKLDQYGLQDLPSMKGHNTIKIGSTISGLGYGEVYVDQFGTILKKRYLFIFGADGGTDLYYEILVNTVEDTIETGFSMRWDAAGSSMKVWQTSGRVILALQNGTDLYINELTSDQWGRQKITLRQILKLPDTLTSWEHYATGFDNYIAAVTPTFVRIYSERLGEYRSLQDLKPSGGLSTFEGVVPVSIPSCKSDVVLLAGAGDAFQSFVWDGYNGGYVLSNETTLTEKVVFWPRSFADVRQISTATPKVIFDTETGVIGIDVHAELIELEDPVWDESEALKSRKQSLEDEYRRQRQVMHNMEGRLNASVAAVTDPVVNITGNITITAPIFVNQTLTTKHLEVTNLTLANTDVDGATYDWYVNHLANISNSSNWLQDLNQTLISIEVTLEDVVNASSVDLKIHGVKVIVENGTFQNLQVTNSTIDTTYDENGEIFPLDSTLQGLIKINDTRKILGKKTFENGLIVDTLVTNQLDDIPVEDIATTNGGYSVLGDVTFTSLTAGEVSMVPFGTIGGVDVSDAVTLADPIRLDEVVFAENLTVTNLEVGTVTVDGVNIEELYNAALTTAGGAVAGILKFTSHVNATTLEAEVLSGINSDTFLSTVVFKDENATLQGTLEIPSFTADRISVTGAVNGKSFPSDFPLKTSSSLDLGTKTFTSVTFENLTLADGTTIDGLTLDDLVTLEGDQVITGSKTFMNDVEVAGNLNVTNNVTIGGVNFDDLYANWTAVLNGMWSRANITFKGVVSLPSIDYNGTLNGFDLGNLSDDILYSSDVYAEITGNKTFKSHVLASSAKLNTFNGQDFDLVVYSSDKRPIKGDKTFQNKVTFEGLLYSYDLIDQVNITLLVDSALYLNKTGQQVTGRKTFNSPVSAAALEVAGKVSDIDFIKVLSTTGDQAFTADQVFSAAAFGDLEAINIVMSENFTVNGVDLSELQTKRMSKNNATDHTGILTVTGNFSAFTLNADKINGYDLQQLKDSIVKNNENAVITSGLSLSNLTAAISVTTPGKVGANGLNISSIDENAVKIGDNNTMTGHATWSSLSLQGNVSVGGLVSGLNLTKLNEDAVFKNVGDQRVTGTKTFNDGFYVKGSIITNTTNGLDLSKRLFTLHSDQTITADYNFTNIKAANLTLKGTFNDIDLNVLNDNALRFPNDNVENATFYENVTVAHIELKSFLNLLNVTQCLKKAVKLNTVGEMVTGTKTFKSNVTFTNVNATIVNGKTLDTYFTNSVRKNTPVPLNINVTQSVSAASVTAKSLEIKGTVDNVDYKTLLQNAVNLLSNENVTSVLEFPSGVLVQGNLKADNLNGLPIDLHYLTTITPQNFSTNVKFASCEAQANIVVDGNVNGVNLTEESTNTLKIHGGQTVTGAKEFGNTTTVTNDVQVTGLLGKGVMVSFATDAVKLADPGTITGSLNFTSGLKVKKMDSSSNVVSNVDLVDLGTNAWYFNSSAVISAPLSFMADVDMKGMFLTNHSIDGFLISQVYSDTNYSLSTYVNYNEGIKDQYVEKCPLILEAFEDTEKAIFEADYFSLVEEMQEMKNYTASEYARVGNNTYVAIAWENCQTSFFWFDYGTYSLKEFTHSFHGTDWEVFSYDGEVYFILASMASGCDSANSSKVYRVEQNNLVLRQELFAAEKVMKHFVQGNVGMALSHGNTSYNYAFNTTTKNFEHVDTVLPEIETLASLLDKDSNFLEFRIVGGKGQLYANGSLLQQVDQYVKSVNHARLFEQHKKTYLVLSVTREITRIEYSLELYTVNPTTGFSWLHTTTLHEPASLSSFYTGNKATGTTLIVVIQEHWYPEVYMLFGMELRQFVELNSPGTYWAQYFNIQDKVFHELSEHYLLLGQRGTKQTLKLEMNGLTHEAEDLKCNPEAFKYPELMAVQKV